MGSCAGRSEPSFSRGRPEFMRWSFPTRRASRTPWSLCGKNNSYACARNRKAGRRRRSKPRTPRAPCGLPCSPCASTETVTIDGMRLRAAIAAFSLQALLPAAAQQQPPDAASDPVILKSVSRAVQLEVLVSDAAGRPVHRLQKNDFAVTDNGHPRDIRIFAGETGPGDHANQLGMPASRGAMALVIDAAPRPAKECRHVRVDRAGVPVPFRAHAGDTGDPSDGTRPTHRDLRRLPRSP